MKRTESNARLAAYRRQIADLQKQMRELREATEPEEVRDYELSNRAGPVRLSELFGTKRDLILVHNMGMACAYCTLWADGYNGIYDHLSNRAAFVISSPDPPEAQERFKTSRGWRFPMVSHHGTSFAADMGFRSESGHFIPGLSVFQRDGARVLRVSDAESRPGDAFCALWHVFDLLPGGAGDWAPRASYP